MWWVVRRVIGLFARDGRMAFDGRGWVVMCKGSAHVYGTASERRKWFLGMRQQSLRIAAETDGMI